MNDVETILYMRDGDVKFSWRTIAEAVGMSKEQARSAYRRAKGTHVRKREINRRSMEAKGAIEHIAFVTDEHFPYQSDAARSVALQIVEDFNPSFITAGSDGMDFYAISSFNNDPTRLLTWQDEIDQWKAGQREWRDAAPNARSVFIVGNHEDRLERWKKKNPEAFSLDALKLPNLIGLDELGIEFADDDEVVFYDKLVIKHGNLVRKDSAYTAKAELEHEAYAISVMSGHTHRGGTFYKRTRWGTVIGQECFCLCGLNPDYAIRPNWQNGIVLATVSEAHLSIEAVPFSEFRGKMVAYWRDKFYEER